MPKWLKFGNSSLPYSDQGLLSFKGPETGLLATPPLMISGTIQESPMKLCTVMVLLKTYHNTIQKLIFRNLTCNVTMASLLKTLRKF